MSPRFRESRGTINSKVSVGITNVLYVSFTYKMFRFYFRFYFRFVLLLLAYLNLTYPTTKQDIVVPIKAYVIMAPRFLKK